MHQKNILVVTHPGTMSEELADWAGRSAQFKLTFADAHERAIELAHQRLFDMVVIDTSNPDINSRKLEAVLPILNAEILVVHYGGEPSGTLGEKVKKAFDVRKAKRIQRLLVLDSTRPKAADTLPPFSAN